MKKPIGYVSGENKYLFIAGGYSIKDELKKLGFRWSPRKKAWYIEPEKVTTQLVEKLLDLGVYIGEIPITLPIISVKYDENGKIRGWEVWGEAWTGIYFFPQMREVAVRVIGDELLFAETPEKYEKKARELEAIPVKDVLDIILIVAYRKRAEVVRDLIEKLEPYKRELAEAIKKRVKSAKLISVGKTEDGFVIHAHGGFDMDYLYAIIYLDKNFKTRKAIIDNHEFIYDSRAEEGMYRNQVEQ